MLHIDQVAEKRDQKAAAMMHTGMMDEGISREEPSHSSWRIPPVVCSAQVTTRRQPPSIVTPSSLHLVRREGDMLGTAVEMETLLDQKKIGVR